ncbi:DgyrCDS13214 [Dimorphilus gyrociliatus]|uniref:DgyrCDS13214 n=1 Tax=Dimorphilus gyrociliatus TaxID=2664684 RepID=A0A7I8WA02_9ANNE|nr:DgyrCDS13214 [Dimorphilus gyrociliatus]
MIITIVCNNGFAQNILPMQQRTFQTGDYTVFVAGENPFWYNVVGRTFMNFRVQGCASVYVYLSDSMAVDDDTIEIGLGVNDNTGVSISNSFSPGQIATYENLLHCNDYRSFWLQWLPRKVSIGIGNSLGRNVIIELNTSMNIADNVVGVGFSARYGNKAAFRIPENSGNMILCRTPFEHSYRYLWKSVKSRNFINFWVDAAAYAHIILARDEGDSQNNIYEVVLGTDFNQKSIIRVVSRGGPEHFRDQKDTPNILKEGESREFWIGWLDGKIEVGKGGVQKVNTILSYQDPNPSPIRYLGISTSIFSSGRWYMVDNVESTNYAFTPATPTNDIGKLYKTLWLNSPRQSYLVFFVKACGWATLHISTRLGFVDQERGLELIIGNDDGNTIIRYITRTEELVTAKTPDALSCTESRPFWLTWDEKTLDAGYGLVPKANSFFGNKKVPIAPDYKVNSIGLATGNNSGGEWRFTEHGGEVIKIHTPDRNTLDYFWRHNKVTKYFKFSVKAKRDASLFLAPSSFFKPSEVPSVKVIIAGWGGTRSIITVRYPGGKNLDSSNERGLLTENEYRPFWVSWFNYEIQVGKGDIVGEQVFLKGKGYRDLVPQIFAVGISTGGVPGGGVDGDWLIEEDKGDDIVFTIGSNNGDWNQDRTILFLRRDKYYLEFNVQACQSAIISLAANENNTPDMIEIEIGANGNTKTIVKSNKFQDVERDTKDILHCNRMKQFYLSWTNGTFIFGTGTEGTGEPLITQKFNSFDIYTGIIKGNPNAKQQKWRIYEDQVFAASTRTYPKVDYTKIWRTVEHRDQVSFRLRSCSEAEIKISHKVTAVDYLIVIGANNNTEILVKRKGFTVIRKLLDKALDCNQTFGLLGKERQLHLDGVKSLVLIS